MRTILKKIFSLLIFFQVFASQSLLLSQLASKDQVIETVWCRDKAGQSYTLFAPAQYDIKKSWPVILIFDPGARGRVGISPFLEAGSKYGFILACSNNSHNGPLRDSFIAADAMLKDLEQRFNVDQKRIYVSGFSGGSRFAVSLAVQEKKIAGVIGCGAGLPNDIYYLPSANSDFLYYGLAGNLDMNYLEMQELPVYLNSRTRVISCFKTFSGGHRWPDSDHITEAVEWLLLKAMNRMIIPADQDFLSYFENKTQKLIDSEISSGNLTIAIMHMRFAVRDFSGTPFATRTLQQLTTYEKSAEYKTAVRKSEKLSADENERRKKYYNYVTEILKSGSIPDSASMWWKIETNYLVRLRDKGSPENSQMASRVQNFISILCSEQGITFYRNKYYVQAAFLFEICTSTDSENPNNYYNLAISLAASGKKKKSLDALSYAMKFGFNSRKTVESDKAFNKMRDDKRYKDLLIKMK